MADLYSELLDSLDSLTDEQLYEIMSRLEVEQEERQKVSDRTANKVGCIHCGSVAVKKHGFKSGKQRYYCKDCHKTFVLSSGTISYHSKLTPTQWKELIRGLIENLSMRKIAENIGTSPTTVWYNKQKVCAAIAKVYGGQDKFVDIAECDEYYTRLSFKGKRDPDFFINTLGRMPRHHRTYAEKMEYLEKHGFLEKLRNHPWKLEQLLESANTYPKGISNEQTCILTCKDRSGNLFMSPVCIGRLETYDVKKNLSGKFESDAIMVTDSHNAYPNFAYSERIQLEQIETGKHAKGAYNLGRINALHSRLADYWPKHSRKAPATKYLDLNLMLFWWLEKNRDLTVPEKVEKLYEIISMNMDTSDITYDEITNRSLSLNRKGLIPEKV